MGCVAEMTRFEYTLDVALARAMTGPPFEIHKRWERDQLQLRMTGELDLATAPLLLDRLDASRADGQAVRLIAALGYHHHRSRLDTSWEAP